MKGPTIVSLSQWDAMQTDINLIYRLKFTDSQPWALKGILALPFLLGFHIVMIIFKL